MIVTLTANPSIDRTVRMERLLPGELNRATSSMAEAGGKGVNVSRVLAAMGVPTLAVLPLSTASRPGYVALAGRSTPLEIIRIRGAVRVNVSLIDARGTTTKINEPGPALEAGEWRRLLARTVRVAQRAEWVVASGSLPPGVPPDFYARLGRDLPGAVRLAVDADGESLRASIGERAALLKPNRAELERLVGRTLPTLGDVVEAAREVLARGPRALLVSLGSDGAVLVDRDGAMHAEASIADADNAVGAGDALLAGFLGAGAGPAALPIAVAWATAACRSAGTQVTAVTSQDRAAVVVHEAAVASRRLAA